MLDWLEATLKRRSQSWGRGVVHCGQGGREIQAQVQTLLQKT